MRRFTRLFAAMLVVAGLGAAMSLVPQKTAEGTQTHAVNVVNTPLPVAATISGTPTVNATISGMIGQPLSVSGSVTIAGTPTVNVASTPPVNVNFPSSIGISGPVSVQNVPTPFGPQPLLQQDFENAARSAFSASCQGSGGGLFGVVTCDLITVPPTKIAVIETVSALFQGNAAASGLITVAELVTTTQRNLAPHFFVPTQLAPLTSTTGGVFFAQNAPVRIYADPGSTVTTAVDSSFPTTNSLSTSWTISGHFVCVTFQSVC